KYIPKINSLFLMNPLEVTSLQPKNLEWKINIIPLITKNTNRPPVIIVTLLLILECTIAGKLTPWSYS
ncbi:hypothetical protein, partial [Yersinia massiliensis]|uniref:hypothetical protein n=1 Tax=Yersinia massiliensis TaxID=419257 RepID=UPI001C9602A4